MSLRYLIPRFAALLAAREAAETLFHAVTSIEGVAKAIGLPPHQTLS